MVYVLPGSSPLARGTQRPKQPRGRSQGLIPARAGNTPFGLGCKVSGGAHPRSRGEHSRSASKKCCRSGSSPLARGTHGVVEWWNNSFGLIPARAGNTGHRDGQPVTDRAHPRSRGEHLMLKVSPGLLKGSSPLARGTRGCSTSARKSPGLIPARAGNTPKHHYQQFLTEAHPRSRGEHDTFSSCFCTVEGSSPLARGTLAHILRLLACFGLIPARAGNTQLNDS